MRVVLQNVLEASVKVNGEIISLINKGYLLLVSFTFGDNQEIIKKMVNKIINLRIFADENGKTNLNLASVNGEILSVSQFTLYADARKGNRPSFVNCLSYDEASKLYEFFNQSLIDYGVIVKKGIFGADMKVSLINDGPFTLILDSKELGL